MLHRDEETGKISPVADWSSQKHLVNPTSSTASLDERARSYLHVNCSHCHQFGAGGTADIELRHEPNGTTREAQIERVVRLGFETRVDLVRDDGERLHVQLTRDEADQLELDAGDIVYVRTRRERTFS